MMEWIYWTISWILMRWHQVWDFILPGSAYFLGTNWDWILAIVFLVITVRIILFPIFVKQIRSQRAMQALQPKMKELQTKYKGDQQTLREEMMKLYQTEKVNPLMGCLPMFLQIPVFLGLFHVLSYLNPVKEKDPDKLYGWTTPLFETASSARIFGAPIPARFADGADLLSVFGATSLNVKVVAGVLVIIMMFTTFMTSRQMILKTGWNPDPQQRMIQKLMLYGIPFSLLLSGWYFPIGVIVYWVTQNIFSFGQQWWVLHKYPPPVSAGAVPASTGNLFARIPVAGETTTPTKAPPPERPVPKAKGTSGGGFLSPVQDAKRSSMFRRKVVAEPTTPVAETRSLGPKPGAKPGAAKASGASATGSSANGTSANGKAVPSDTPAAKPSTTSVTSSKDTPPAKATPGKAAPAAGAKQTSGGKPAGAKPQQGGAKAKSGGGKKGQPSKKGGPRR